jgi:hypothetical protein
LTELLFLAHHPSIQASALSQHFSRAIGQGFRKASWLGKAKRDSWFVPPFGFREPLERIPDFGLDHTFDRDFERDHRRQNSSIMETMRWSEPNVSTKDSLQAPTIKNHSVTQFNGYLYCFGA